MKSPLLCIVISISFLFIRCSNNSAHENAAREKTDTAEKASRQEKVNDKKLGHGTMDSGGRTDYNIVTPAGWTKKTDTVIRNGRFVRLVSPFENAADKFPENITVITDKALKPGLDNYYKSGKEGMQKNLPGIIFQGDGDTVINNIVAKWIKCIFPGTKDITYKVLMYLLMKGDYGYVITCTSIETDYDRFEKTFKETAGSFTIGQ